MNPRPSTGTRRVMLVGAALTPLLAACNTGGSGTQEAAIASRPKGEKITLRHTP